MPVGYPGGMSRVCSMVLVIQSWVAEGGRIRGPGPTRRGWGEEGHLDLEPRPARGGGGDLDLAHRDLGQGRFGRPGARIPDCQWVQEGMENGGDGKGETGHCWGEVEGFWCENGQVKEGCFNGSWEPHMPLTIHLASWKAGVPRLLLSQLQLPTTLYIYLH